MLRQPGPLWTLLLLACTGHAPKPAPADTPPADTQPAATAEPSGDHFVLAGGTVVGLGLADVEIAEGKIVAVVPASSEAASPGVSPDAERLDVTGRFLLPSFVDSHVHLAYLPEEEALADGGIAAAVDLAAPLSTLGQAHTLRVLASGPMVTAEGGYPVQSWGRDGYGYECADADAAVAAVETLAAAGAEVIKLPITTAPVLDAEALAAAVGAAHRLGLKVASHATSDAQALAAAEAGVDILAHTPTEALSEATLDAWAGRVVITTVRAFGASGSTLSNLSALKARGVTILYGTDFGNTSTKGIDTLELSFLSEAGMSNAEILASGTSVPAAFWGLPLGAFSVGNEASLLVLPGDPLLDLGVLSTPSTVFLQGKAR